MVKIEIVYQGDLHTQATHTPSGATLVTDAPLDNGGRGESFSPTDLVATALGTCMITIMSLYAKRHRLELAGTRVEVAKEMAQAPVRRISKLQVDIHVPLPSDSPHCAGVTEAALTCPVFQSLHPDVQKPVRLHWQEPILKNALESTSIVP